MLADCALESIDHLPLDDAKVTVLSEQIKCSVNETKDLFAKFRKDEVDIIAVDADTEERRPNEQWKRT